jgi:hypothetical protein
MKKFYIVRGRFSNEYSLFYAENAADFAALPESAEQITRKQAQRLARDEVERRKYDRAFSGYADSAIYPAALIDAKDAVSNESRYTLKNRIFERV